MWSRAMVAVIGLGAGACNDSGLAGAPGPEPEQLAASPPVVHERDCSGAWLIVTPTVGDANCPFADPHALSFSVDASGAAYATRAAGEHAALELTRREHGCTGTLTFDDRLSAEHGSITLVAEEHDGVITGRMSRACSESPVELRGRREPQPQPDRDPVPAATLRQAYARILEVCTIQHDLLAMPTSQLDFSISASGRLLELRRDGRVLDLATACAVEDGTSRMAGDGMFGFPGQPLQRSLTLQHRVADELGVGPLVLGLHIDALPRLGLTSGPKPEGSVRFEQDGEARPASIRFGGTWRLFDGDGHTVLEAFDDPGDLRVDRIRSTEQSIPGIAPLGEFLDLGSSPSEVLRVIDGWVAPDLDVDAEFRGGARVLIPPRPPHDPVRPLSPCSFAVGDDTVAFAGRDPIFWADGGFVQTDEIFLCRSNLVFHARPGESRVFERGADPFAPADSWHRTRGGCEVELRGSLAVACYHDRSNDPGFVALGNALFWQNGSKEPRLERRGLHRDRDSLCEQVIDRFWLAFAPSLPFFELPQQRSPELVYKLSWPTRRWSAECEVLPETTQRCLLAAKDVRRAHAGCAGAPTPSPPPVAWDLDLRRTTAPALPPTPQEAHATFERLRGTWGDPDARYGFGARFFRRAGKMWVTTQGKDYEVELTGPRTLHEKSTEPSIYRTFAFVDDDHLFLNNDAIRPRPTSVDFKAGFHNAFVASSGTCTALDSAGMASAARCTFQRQADASETLLLERANAATAELEVIERIPVVDGMLVHPDLEPFTRAPE